jgi:uncharacterized protein (DUF885 family)
MRAGASTSMRTRPQWHPPRWVTRVVVIRRIPAREVREHFSDVATFGTLPRRARSLQYPVHPGGIPMSTLRSILASALVALSLPAVAATDWVERSNANAQPLLKVIGDFAPEQAASLGLPGYDEKVFDYGKDVNSRFRDQIASAKKGLEALRTKETDPRVKQDLDIMIEAANQQIASSLVNEKYLLPYLDVGQTIFQGEFALLQDDVDAARRPAALTRLNRYTGLESGFTPITELAKQRWNEKASDPKLLGPVKNQIDQALANTARYVDGVRKLYAKYEIKGAEKALDTLESQLKDYDAWIKTTVMARARTDFRLPPDLYADNLIGVGLDIAPEDLVKKAQLSYAEIRNEMQAIAPLVAKEHGLKVTNYRDVIKALKKEQLAKDQVEPTYKDVIGKVEDIIRRERIVTLPQRAMQLRLATEAETAAQPAPHMDPPPMIGNKGERGTFVLTAGNPSGGAEDAYDDFSHKSATWTLTAHEGRPGHELQFSAIVERGVSLARTLFAFNSVNVEGWALYAEAEMVPSEPAEGQMIALQFRLLRAARAMLDPMLNLGMISREDAGRVLTGDVVLSPAMARQELDRYTFNSPGQAGSYFYGYSRILQLRAETEVALGDAFDRLAFNNFLLDQGLLPPDLLARAVREEFVPAQKARRAAARK